MESKHVQGLGLGHIGTEQLEKRVPLVSHDLAAGKAADGDNHFPSYTQ